MWPGLAVVVLAAVLFAVGGEAGAAFTAQRTSSSSFAAAGSFPDYPTAVTADNPLFFYRGDDQPGSPVATDSSGNGVTGVYASQGASFMAPFSEGAGTTAHDDSGAATPSDLSLSNVGWGSGRVGRAGVFDGTSSVATTAGPVVATTADFTVSAWVYLTDSSTTRTVVSQDGTSASGFSLQYLRSSGRWALAMPRSDQSSPTTDVVLSTAAPSLNTWTSLVATYTASSGSMALYVNGILQSTGTHTGSWSATGSLVVGGDRSGGVRADRWAGRVQDVRTWSSVVPSPSALYAAFDSGPSSSWSFSESSGTQTADSATGLVAGTLGSGATWTTGVSGSGLALDGTANGYVDGSTAAVNTAKSFTVSAWVYLTDNAVSHVIASQSGSIGSGFLLRFNGYGNKWEFAVSQAESYAPTYDSSYSPAGLPALNTWTHLVGVYDSGAAAGQNVTLYVNGVAQTPVGHTSVWNATGPFEVGRVREFGAWQTGSIVGWGPWPGRVDDVRTFARALSRTDVATQYNGGVGGAATLGPNALGLPGTVQGAISGQQASTSIAYSGSSSNSFDPTPYAGPATYTIECWFRAAGGGTLIDFGSAASGSSATISRRLHLSATGQLDFGTASGTSGVIRSPAGYADGRWHFAAVTVSPTAGNAMYVDGVLSSSSSATSSPTSTGYWRWGGDTHDASWPSPDSYTGLLDEVAVFPTALSAQQIAAHYAANR